MTPLTTEERELLAVLNDTEWRMVNAGLTNVHPFWADSLVRAGLAESRPRESKPGAYLYRRTAAGRAALKGGA